MRQERATTAAVANREPASGAVGQLTSLVEAVALLDESSPMDICTANPSAGHAAEPRPTPPVAASRSREVEELNQQLGAKDELISALVGELEQVVEQLDRMQRQGQGSAQGQSPNRSQTAAKAVNSLPAEVVEEHQQVLTDLQRVVEQWEALQASSVLGRIETEIGELRSLMLLRTGPALDADGSSRETVETNQQLDSVISRLALERPNRIATSHAPAPSGSSWEAIKQRMMNGDEEPADPTAVAVLEHVEERVEESAAILPPLHTLAAPQPVNLETATLAQLQQACAERDAYLVHLTRMLRSRHAVSLPDNWDDIQDVPAELKARANQLANRLEEQVRLAEVEISLDRARLSRERLQLQSDRDLIEKHLKRLGLSSLDELESVAVDGSSTSDRRWMRFLGVNRRG